MSTIVEFFLAPGDEQLADMATLIPDRPAEFTAAVTGFLRLR
jgi:hypothetical protein